VAKAYLPARAQPGPRPGILVAVSDSSGRGDADVDDEPPAGTASRRQRWRRVLVLVAAVLGVLFAAFSWRWFMRPTADGPVAADAIVMLGGAGERFPKAVELAEDGWADVLVVSDPIGDGDRYSAHGRFCRDAQARDRGYEVICFDPETDTTRGEARYVAQLAEDRGWRIIDLVTTPDQTTRARMLVSRCWDGEIASVTVPTDESRLGRIVYEWGATLRALTQRRGC
jgi:uncharacterized SAM-binding protein YcdF (DUF218 family)